MPASTTAPTGPTAGLTPEVRGVVTALIFGGIAAILDTTIVTIALHTLVIKLHSTVGTIQWVSTGYLLALAVAIPVTGWPDELCNRLVAGGRRMIRYDVRDTGRSQSYPPGQLGYSLADLVDDAAGVLYATATERAHVAGMSTGG